MPSLGFGGGQNTKKLQTKRNASGASADHLLLDLTPPRSEGELVNHQHSAGGFASLLEKSGGNLKLLLYKLPVAPKATKKQRCPSKQLCVTRRQNLQVFQSNETKKVVRITRLGSSSFDVLLLAKKHEGSDLGSVHTF